VFCRRNGETAAVYLSHPTKDPRTGLVVCPQLRNYRCELCGATGPEAHTRSYCPNLRPFKQRPTPTPSDNSAALMLPPPVRHSLTLERRPRTPIQLDGGQSEGAASRRASSDEELVFERPPIAPNMSRVTNSRYNSAGNLRAQRHPLNQRQQSSSGTPMETNEAQAASSWPKSEKDVHFW